jgi:hypothetical protein
MFGFLLKVNLAGWRQFCAEHNLDAELCWSCLPGFQTIQNAEQTAQTAAFTPEGAAHYLERSGRKPGKAPTPDDVAAGLRAALQARAEWWG